MATNVNIPTSDSNLHDWVAWHKDLVKTYNSASVLLSSKDGKTTFGANELASNLWNAEWDKLGLFATAKNNIGNPITTDYNDDKKYLRMWLDLRPSVALGLIQYDPTFTGIQIGVQAGEAAVDTAEGIAKFAAGIIANIKTIAIVGGVLVLVGFSAYVYSSFKKVKS